MEIYQTLSTPELSSDISSFYMNGWNPSHTNGAGRSNWGKPDGHGAQEPSVCWDDDGHADPLTLQGLSAEEKDVSHPPKPSVSPLCVVIAYLNTDANLHAVTHL
jgi:hypothetical protein